MAGKYRPDRASSGRIVWLQVVCRSLGLAELGSVDRPGETMHSLPSKDLLEDWRGTTLEWATSGGGSALASCIDVANSRRFACDQQFLHTRYIVHQARVPALALDCGPE
jgi:hypothetical protein